MAKKTKKYVWVVTAHSESGDHFGPETFHSKPTTKQLKALCADWDNGDDEWNGPGDYGSYCYLSVDKSEVK